jgi:hypothetical protein
MSCPYLTEVTMCFCRAYPVRKLVPSGRVLTESACEGESYGGCPVFREALTRLSVPAARGLEASVHPTTTQGGES